MSAFFYDILFAAVGWPIVCFATLASMDKIAADKMSPVMRISTSNILTGFATLVFVAYAAHCRFVMRRPNAAYEHAVISTSLAHLVFFVQGAWNWDRVGIVYLVYVFVMYLAITETVLIPYFVLFFFFRLVQSITPAVVGAFEINSDAVGIFKTATRVVETIVLASVCASAVWTLGYPDPVVCGLAFPTVYGTKLRLILQKKSPAHSM